MQTHAQKIRLGVFLFISSILVIFLIGYFTAREFFEKTDTYYIAYKDVSVGGMEVGSPVQYLGIKTGTISNIHIDPDDINTVIVEISLKHETPIKEDARADIITMGITGLRGIEIRGGSNEADLLEPGEFLSPGGSLTEDITGKAEVIAEKAEMVLNNLLQITRYENIEKVSSILDKYENLATNTNHAVLRIDSLVENNSKNVTETITSAKDITQIVQKTSKNLYETSETINQGLNNDTLNIIMTNIFELSEKLKETEINRLIEDIGGVAAQTHQLLIRLDDDINRGSRDLVESQKLLKETLHNLNEASRKINSDPSILIRGASPKGIPDDELQ
ncbi:MlaD family protein [Marinilabiliaceae bacterium ANBcel2]|nr:MlaD family protein [Marinilabiliaceae bacterium ANBcel2]